MEIIEKIEGGSFSLVSNKYGDNFDGFVVTTNKQVIKLGIGNGQSCCESWGYFMSNDDIQDFVGAQLFEIKKVDEALNVAKLEDNQASCAFTMFVNLETSNGTLQFTAYNDHNGYYGHEAVVASETFNISECL